MFGYQKKFRLPFPQSFHRKFGIQSKPAVHGNHNAQALMTASAADMEPADHVSAKLTAAGKMVIEPLFAHLYFSCQLPAKKYTIVSFQKQRPLQQSMPQGDWLFMLPGFLREGRS